MSLKAKDLTARVNKTVVVLPLHNAVRKRAPLADQVTTVEITKVGVTKAYFKVLGMNQGFSINGALDNHGNGYLAFSNEEAALEFIEAKKIAINLTKMDFSKLSYTELSALQAKLTK
jgi:hypothetical protein